MKKKYTLNQLCTSLILLLFLSFSFKAQEKTFLNCDDENSTEFIDAFNNNLNQIARSNTNQELINLPVIAHLIGFPNNESTLEEDGIARYFSVINSYVKEIGLRLYLVEVRYIAEDPVVNDLNVLYQYMDTTAYNLPIRYTDVASGGSYNVLSFLGRKRFPVENFDFDSTPIHELGHNYGLSHTFSYTECGNSSTLSENVARTGPQANCNIAGDRICDTPADNRDRGLLSCSSDDVDRYGLPYSPDFDNIMSYYFRPKTLTPQQYEVMRAGFEYDLTTTSYTRLGVTYTYDLDAYIQTVVPEAPVFNTLEATHLDNRMSWSSVANSMGYIVERSETSSTDGFVAMALSGVAETKTEFIDRNIEPNTTYWYRVIPVNSKDAYSNVLEVISNDLFYCTPNSLSSCSIGFGNTQYYPKRVTLSSNGTTILNTTDINCDRNIILNDQVSTILEPNKEYLLELDMYAYNDGFYNVFLDLNRDGDFEDTNEWLLQNVPVERLKDVAGTFILPYEALESGSSIIRMAYSRFSVSNACSINTNAISSTQDYKITLDKPNYIYVNDDASGLNNGRSWENAYRTINSAFSKLNNDPTVEAILIKEGTYKSSSASNASFYYPKRPVKIYGGFPDTISNPSFDDKDPKAYKTILDGNVANLDSDADNSKHQIKIKAGYVVEDGDFVIDGINFINNTYGALHISSYGERDLNIYINNCVFKDNIAILGSAIISWNSSTRSQNNITVSKSIFTNNGYNKKANHGAVYVSRSNFKAENCLFENNYGVYGGGVYIRSNTVNTAIILNSTFVKNEGQIGASVLAYFSPVEFVNSISWGNTSTNYPDTDVVADFGIARYITLKNSLFDKDVCSTGYFNTCENIIYESDLPFLNFGESDYRLNTTTSALNHGEVSYGVVDDIDGNTRGELIDLGCYESSISLTNRSSLRLANSNNKEGDKEIVVHPNPTKGFLNLSYPNSYKKGEISILNIKGQLINTINTKGENRILIDLSDYSKGMYIIKGLFDNDIKILKILKE